MVLAGGTAAVVPSLQPECQQLSLLRTASPPVPQPWHSPERPSIPETVLEFWRCLQWRPELAGVAWSLERPGGRGEGVLSGLPLGAGNLKDLHMHSGKVTSQERKQGHSGQYHQPVYHSMV